MASTEPQRVPTRERRPSTSAPIVDIQGSVSPAGISRPKHKRTFTGFGAGDIKTVEGGVMPILAPILHRKSGTFTEPGGRFPSGPPHSIPGDDVQVLTMFVAQLPSPSPSGRLGPSTRPRASRTRMASRTRSSATSRPPWRAASSTATSRPHTPPPAWPSGTASSSSGTGPSSATPSPTASGSTT